MDGYVFLWRKSIDSPVFKNPELWQLWTWCLMRANHKATSINIKTGRGSTVVNVGIGQFIWGRNTCAESLSCNPSTVNKRMKKLENMGCISIESNTHFSTVSICNYSEYQSRETANVTTKEQPSNNQVTTKEQPSNTDNNDKNDKNNKKEKYTPKNHLRAFGIEDQLIDDFLATRKLKKLASTKTAIDGIEREAKKAGLGMKEVLELCCENGWGGFKARWPRPSDDCGNSKVQGNPELQAAAEAYRKEHGLDEK